MILGQILSAYAEIIASGSDDTQTTKEYLDGIFGECVSTVSIDVPEYAKSRPSKFATPSDGKSYISDFEKSRIIEELKLAATYMAASVGKAGKSTSDLQIYGVAMFGGEWSIIQQMIKQVIDTAGIVREGTVELELSVGFMNVNMVSKTMSYVPYLDPSTYSALLVAMKNSPYTHTELMVEYVYPIMDRVDLSTASSHLITAATQTIRRNNGRWEVKKNIGKVDSNLRCIRCMYNEETNGNLTDEDIMLLNATKYTQSRTKSINRFSGAYWDFEINSIVSENTNAKGKVFKRKTTTLEIELARINIEGVVPAISDVLEELVDMMCVWGVERNTSVWDKPDGVVTTPSGDGMSISKYRSEFYNMIATDKIITGSEFTYISTLFNTLFYNKEVRFVRDEPVKRFANMNMSNVSTNDLIEAPSGYMTTLKLDGYRTLMISTPVGMYYISPPGIIIKAGPNTSNLTKIIVLDGEVYIPKIENIPADVFKLVGRESSVKRDEVVESVEVEKPRNVVNMMSRRPNPKKVTTADKDPDLVTTVPGKGYYVFDVMYDSVPVTGKKFQKRYDMILPLIAEIQLHRTISNRQVVNSRDDLNLYAKVFTPIGNQLLGPAISTMNSVMESGVVSIDGVVLQSTGKYFTTSKKWKPVETLSIDFRCGAVVRDPITEEENTMYYAQVAGGAYFSASLRSTNTPVGDTLIISAPKDAGGRIVEVIIDPHREDDEEIDYLMLHFNRYRSDKETPNGFRTAKSVYTDMIRPISMDVLTNVDTKLLRQYHNKIKDLILDVAIDATTTRFQMGVNLLDIGSGNGGDLNKWLKSSYSADISTVIAVEPDETNAAEFIRRRDKGKYNTSDKDRINLLNMPINASILHDNDVLSAVNLITAFYSMTFMFENEETLRDTFKSLQNVPVGTMFAVVVFDGGRLDGSDVADLYTSDDGADTHTMTLVEEGDDVANYQIRTGEDDADWDYGQNVGVLMKGSKSLLEGAGEFQNEFKTSGKELTRVAENHGFECMDPDFLGGSVVVDRHYMRQTNLTTTINDVSVGEATIFDHLRTLTTNLSILEKITRTEHSFGVLNETSRVWSSLNKLYVFVKKDSPPTTRKSSSLSNLKKTTRTAAVVKNIFDSDDDSESDDGSGYDVESDPDDPVFTPVDLATLSTEIFGDDDDVTIDVYSVGAIAEEYDVAIVFVDESKIADVSHLKYSGPTVRTWTDTLTSNLEGSYEEVYIIHILTAGREFGMTTDPIEISIRSE